MSHKPASGGAHGRSLLLLFGAAVLIMTVLITYRLSVTRGEEIAAAEVATRNYAAIFDARLDASLRRIDADLKSLVREVPVAALNPQTVSRYAQELNARLDSRLFNFREIAGYRVTDVKGDTLYTSASAGTARINVSDRDYFQMLRDNPTADLVFSEVVTGRTTGRQVIAVARALKDGRGEFAGIIYGILELDYLQKLFQALDLGPQGLIALRRSDNHALVVSNPPLPLEINKTLDTQNPVVQSLAAGKKLATLQFAAQVDGIQRIISIHALQDYPFYFAVGASRHDVLAPWRTRALVAVSVALALLGLVAGVLYRLWRTREREMRIVADLSRSEELFRHMAEGIDRVFFKAASDYSRFDYISPVFDRIWGHPRAELMDDPMVWLNWVHADDRETVRRYVAENRHRESYALKFRIARADGELRWIHAHAFRLAGTEDADAVVGFQADVTESKQAEELIRHERDFISEALDSLPGLFYLIEDTGRFLRWNQNFEMVSGYSAAEIATMSPLDFFGEGEKDVVARAIERVFAEGEASVDAGYLSKDGTRTPFLFNGKRCVIEGKLCLMGMGIDISERKQAEQALRENEEKMRSIFENVPVGIFISTREGKFSYVNPALSAILCYESCEELMATVNQGSIADVLYVDKPRREMIIEQMEQGNRHWHTVENRYWRKDGRVIDAILSLSKRHDAVTGAEVLYGIVTDITERKRAEADLRIAATAFESQEGMLIADIDETILRINRAGTEITGYSSEEAVGRTPRLFSSGRQNADFYRAMWARIAETGAWNGEMWNRRKDGEIYPCWTSISAVKGEDGRITHYVASFIDISQRKTAEDEIRNLAFYDSLTNLPNRRLLLDRLRQALLATARSESTGALLFIDLDNFKTLNDTLGHDKGDLLLESVARRLIASIREEDTVARLGGDEFVVMLEGLSLNLNDAGTQTRLVGEKILHALNEHHDLAGLSYHSTASIGIALFAHQTDTVDELLKRADLAMYQAKAAGRNTLRFFDPEMQSVVMARVALEADLREGLRQNHFVLYYQPQVAADGGITGAEALLRWRHPGRGMIPPLEFIPLAEETGLILPLGNWVLETACARLNAWAANANTAQLTLSVNVSARQFRHADFVEQVLAVLQRSGADPQRLELELTESLLLEDVEGVIAKMTALKARGVCFSLDDFVTGYSSLSYLKRLPLDELKIDQSFVRDVLTDPNDAAIARTIVALGRSMGLIVIAEGVETREQRDFLAANGCSNYQGYLFGRPVPADEFEQLLNRA